ncbi:hypothetical protein REDROCK_90 [Mycobacterium phage RedRock]|uniref:Uncharacterized protein n=1 Tax=Mycobacterium phage RedRock TaxID=711470 RepID=D3JZF2_9CAUD|nr:hypothetical protein REDROCK_90 [Mycobacterium phage RedRock]YP_009303545.1 hypothetical protein SEA_LOSER_92 [Mycobacterium phage Loser]ADB93783.1 hypothetical protein REDROCK_90 [Mycobacterium phage RedRock]AMS00988.1 hypothetical protein SEA_LOSER_92 [Mycobacterium phage Loser]
MSFEVWMKHVDGLLTKAWGVTSRDIADRTYRDSYEDGESPARVVRDIIAEGIDAL